MRVLLLRTWITNIGNGFIEKGAKQIIQQSYPNADIVEVSGYPQLAEDRLSKGMLAGTGDLLPDTNAINKIRDSKSSQFKLDKEQNSVNISELIDADLAVLPGCILYRHGIGTYSKVLQQLSERDIPIILLGAGGGSYDDEAQSFVSSMIQSLNIKGLITRDSTAYDCYSHLVEHTYDGIDCAFFINDWYEPPSANQDLVIATFDKTPERDIQTDKTVIRPSHTPFGDVEPHESPLKRIVQYDKNKKILEGDNAFLSDNLKDYLFLYANADSTYSDRIHACIPSLAYGNQAQFLYETPRANLFDRVVEDDLSKNPCSLDSEQIQDEKEKQVQEFQRIADKIVE